MGLGIGALGSAFEGAGLESVAEAFYGIGNALTMVTGVITLAIGVMSVLTFVTNAAAAAKKKKAGASYSEMKAEYGVVAATIA